MVACVLVSMHKSASTTVHVCVVPRRWTVRMPSLACSSNTTIALAEDQTETLENFSSKFFVWNLQLHYVYRNANSIYSILIFFVDNKVVLLGTVCKYYFSFSPFCVTPVHQHDQCYQLCGHCVVCRYWDNGHLTQKSAKHRKRLRPRQSWTRVPVNEFFYILLYGLLLMPLKLHVLYTLNHTESYCSHCLIR